MKHLKLFENETQFFWLVDYFIKEENDHQFILYPDKESAENVILEIINDERKEESGANKKEYTNNMYFTDVKDALRWYHEHYSDIEITYQKIQLSSPVIESEELKRMRDVKKYNL